MPENRFYIDQELARDKQVSITGTECHHLTHVMRQGVGDDVELINGRGVVAEARIETIEKNCVILNITNFYEEEKNDFEVILAQAIPRISRLDIIVEKGCELGMTKL